MAAVHSQHLYQHSTTPATACSEETEEGEEDGTTTGEENAGFIRRRRRTPSGTDRQSERRGNRRATHAQAAPLTLRQQPKMGSSQPRGWRSRPQLHNCSSSTKWRKTWMGPTGRSSPASVPSLYACCMEPQPRADNMWGEATPQWWLIAQQAKHTTVWQVCV